MWSVLWTCLVWSLRWTACNTDNDFSERVCYGLFKNGDFEDRLGIIYLYMHQYDTEIIPLSSYGSL